MNQSKQENVTEPRPTKTVNEALPATPKLTAFQIRSAKAKHALQAIGNRLLLSACNSLTPGVI